MGDLPSRAPRPDIDLDALVAAWMTGLIERQMGAMTRGEYLKAIRALSSRYVERRADLPNRSPLDSAGKRAAFAGFYAPLHFLTVRVVVQALGLDQPPEAGAGTGAGAGPGAARRPVTRIVDAGCGTGVAGAAWALAHAAPPPLTGVDLSAWALSEARHTWRALGLAGRAERGDLVAALERLTRRPAEGLGVIAGWSLNELPAAARTRAEQALLDLGARGATVVVLEPLATRAAPWWDRLASRVGASAGRADAWRLDVALPAALAQLDRDAGFDRAGLTARSLVLR